MDGYISATALALWLGIQTSISPCPLATNIAAISFLSRCPANKRQVLVAGLLYTLGRVLAYLILGVVLAGTALSVPVVARFLQRYMNIFLGPVLIIIGIFLLELIPLRFTGWGIGERFQQWVARSGIVGAALLGFVFALSFCPVSAALFFGNLTLSLKYSSVVTFPVLYGIGTALPVIVFALILALGAQKVGKAFDRLTQVEKWARRVTGCLFILVGSYLCLTFMWRVFS